MFFEAWRITRDEFARPDMNGVAWEARTCCCCSLLATCHAHIPPSVQTDTWHLFTRPCASASARCCPRSAAATS